MPGSYDVSLRALRSALLELAESVPGVDERRIRSLVEEIENGPGVVSMRRLVYGLLEAGVPLDVIVRVLKGIVFEREDEIGESLSSIAEEEFEERVVRTAIDYVLQKRGGNPWR